MSDNKRTNTTLARKAIDEKINSGSEQAKKEERSDMSEAEKLVEQKLSEDSK